MKWLRFEGPTPLPHQRGAAAIEFALVFPLFFLLFYGLVNWGLILTLQHNMNYAAQHAARAALAADPEAPGYAAKMQSLANTTATTVLAWLPADWTANTNVGAAIVNRDGVDWLQVTISYPNYRKHPLLPLIHFSDGAAFPPVPNKLLGQAELRLGP